MKVDYINPVLTAVISTLETMAQLEAVPGTPVLKDSAKAPGIITGIIELKGPKACGSLALSFPEPVILDIYNKMLREDKTAIDEMVVDLVGELANIVMGGAKKEFDEQGMKFGLTLPTIVDGKNHHIIHPIKGKVISLPLDISSGTVYAEFCFKMHEEE